MAHRSGSARLQAVQAAHLHLRADGAVVLVLAERERHVVAPGRGELGEVVEVEVDGLARGAVAAHAVLRVPLVAREPRRHDLGAVQQQRHLAVAEPVRRQQLELVGEAERELVAADDGVDVAHAQQVVGAERRRRPRRRTRRGTPGWRRAAAAGRRRRGARRTSAGGPSVRSTAPSRSNAGMLRPEPLASSSPSLSRMAGRWKRSATREATMPTTPSCQSGDESTSAAGGGSGTMASAASSIAASMVWRSRLSSLSLSASGSAASRSALPSSSSAMEASSRRPAALSRGPRRKPTVPASTARRPAAGDLEQRRQPRPRRAAQPAEADRREHAVLLDQRHHVGDGADGDEVGVRAQRQRQVDELVAGVLEQRVRQLEGHADAGEVAARVRAELGRDDDAVGQVALELVVVGDDDVHAERLRPARPRRAR